MTSGALKDAGVSTGGSEATGDRRARRVAELFASDPQFRGAQQLPAVIEAARRPGVRLAPMLATLVDGYGDRPALGQRGREVTTDPATGQPRRRLLPEFDTTTYARAVVAGRAPSPPHGARPRMRPSMPGDFVATIGFASADYLTIDLVCALPGPGRRCRCSTTRRRAAAADHRRGRADGPRRQRRLPRPGGRIGARESVGCGGWSCSTTAPTSTTHRRPARARHGSGSPAGHGTVVVETLDDEPSAARPCPPNRSTPAATDRAAGDDPVHLGQHRRAQGRDVHRGDGAPPCGRCRSRRPTPGAQRELPAAEPPRRPDARCVGSFLAGGTSYFVARDATCRRCSRIGRWCAPPTSALVPRVVDMLFQRYRSRTSTGWVAAGSTSGGRDRRQGRTARARLRRPRGRRLRQHRTAGPRR